MLLNARTGHVVADQVELADTRPARRTGLLGRQSLAAASALILRPCFAVHTISMKFAIDVVFVNREGVVVKVARNLSPGRMAAAWTAHAAIELGAGGAGEVEVGDRLYLAAERAPVGAAVSWPLPA
jgi:uncharacterized membrane protein (UPF0127 family)